MNSKKAKEYLSSKLASIMSEAFEDPTDPGKTCLLNKALRDLVEENLILTQQLS